MVQFDEPAFNVYMPEVSGWGIEALNKAAEGPDLRDRGSHLLRLWHPAEQRLESRSRRRMAAV